MESKDEAPRFCSFEVWICHQLHNNNYITFDSCHLESALWYYPDLSTVRHAQLLNLRDQLQAKVSIIALSSLTRNFALLSILRLKFWTMSWGRRMVEISSSSSSHLLLTGELNSHCLLGDYSTSLRSLFKQNIVSYKRPGIWTIMETQIYMRTILRSMVLGAGIPIPGVQAKMDLSRKKGDGLGRRTG